VTFHCFECGDAVGGEDVCPVCNTAVCSTCCVNYDAGSAHDADVHLIPMWDAPEPGMIEEEDES
jgi:hypothetical protein